MDVVADHGALVQSAHYLNHSPTIKAQGYIRNQMASIGVDENPNFILLAVQLHDTRKLGVTSNTNRRKFNNCLTTPTKILRIWDI